MRRTTFLEHNTTIFKKVAPYYDWLDLIIAQVRKDFVSFVSPMPDVKILDAATGTGKQAFAFAEHGNSVTALDLSPDMLAVARRKNHFQTITFTLGDACALPFDDGTFDLSVMSFALHCMPLEIRIHAIRELKRVTNSGGKVAFVDYGLPSNRLGRQLVYSFISLYETAYWREFIRSELETHLHREGLRIEKHRHFFLGSMRMFLCSLA